MEKKRRKISAEERVIVVEKVLNSEVGLNQAAKQVALDLGTILN